ncbi:CBS domain-containing protein [Pseudonocardia sp. N23]|uniref:CBS domain-containing protein n=1 Tax=Pseudonocardia sp. N23 TaxID=1987376 RepID=UPI000BFD9E8F|nr:CBS domain-containing protein [Pseudonocardia sp. N23]GAY12196.1 CBS domain protein [Pseudonocardia sp. N23]
MNIADVLDAKGRTVHSVVPWATVAEAVERLEKHRVGALLVSDGDGRIRGIVSERDVIRELARRGERLLSCNVEDIMTRNVATVSSTESLTYAMAQMTRGRYRHLPVVDNGQLSGMVSIGDLVQHRVREMELQTGVLRDAYIAAR